MFVFVSVFENFFRETLHSFCSSTGVAAPTAHPSEEPPQGCPYPCRRSRCVLPPSPSPQGASYHFARPNSIDCPPNAPHPCWMSFFSTKLNPLIIFILSSTVNKYPVQSKALDSQNISLFVSPSAPFSLYCNYLSPSPKLCCFF